MDNRIVISLLVTFCFLSLTIEAQTVITGKVFIDNNRNGVLDPLEKGVSNVKITDGFNFVWSGDDGSFSIEAHPKARFIYMSIPALFDPSGAHYSPLPILGNVDFGLIPRPDQSSSFIQTSDNEENTYRSWMDEIKAFIKNESPAFVITSGDICYEKGLRMHAREFTYNKMGVRTHLSIGNHDLLSYGAYGEALFEALFGPSRYSFDVANTHFVVFPMLYGDNPTGYNAKEVFGWIKNDLDLVSPEQKVVICSHDLYLREVRGVPMLVYQSDTLRLDNYPIDSYIYGHRHNLMSQLLPQTSIKCFGTGTPNKGSRDHTPAAYRLFTLHQDGSISSQTRYSFQNALLCPHVSLASQPQNITVNVYHSPADICEIALVNGQNTTLLQKRSDWSWSTQQKIVIEPHTSYNVTATTKDGSRFTAPLLPSDRLVWSLSLGGMTTIYPPLLVGDTLFVATHDDKMGDGNQICAIDPVEGTVLWRFRTPLSIKSALAYHQGKVLACDAAGTLYAIDATTGTLCWDRQMLSFSPTSFQQGVTAHNGVVYICSGSTSAAVDLLDGKIVWNRNLMPVSSNTSASTVVYKNILLSGTHWTSRYALNMENGEVVWEQSDKGLRNCESAPSVYDDLLYYAGFEYLVVVDPKDGQIVMSERVSGVLGSASTPYVDQDFIITGSSDRGIFAFSRKDLSALWNFLPQTALTYTVAYTQNGQQSVEASPIVVNGVVYCGANDGTFYALDAKTGTFLWSYHVGAPILSSAVWHRGYLLFTDMAGNLYRITPAPPH
ncbi:MAG: PQQ-binding-like beta-propeller repeat protein [Prevotellaceae bacterium]|jgi:outer membrane protein assembly factor BamB|nr:PQQ-binding-like beta-propeller repeat protein [Prevotellaceae bacterium]